MKTVEDIAKTSNLLIVENTEQGGEGFIEYGALKNCTVIWTRDQGGYDHVSINPKKRLPSWEEMCKVKDMFFYEEEECYQVHPKKSEYVNLAKNCLHIWRNTGDDDLRDEIIEKAAELLEKAVEEIENLYNRDTELTNQIRGFLNKQLGVDVWTEQMIAEANAEEEP